MIAPEPLPAEGPDQPVAALAGRRLVVTGVATTDSIAFATARSAQLAGAEIVLTALPRDRERAEEAAAHLPERPPILELDLTDPEHVAAVRGELAARWGRVDGALHAVAFAPREALAGDFLAAGPEAVERAFRTSTFTYATLAGIVADLAPPSGASVVGLDFDAAGAWPVYNWMGVCKAALEATNRYLARDLGPRRVRTNLIAAGPLHTRAAGGIPGFDALTDAWERGAPLAWDPSDAAPVGETACFLLSDAARMITGTILHVDGGYHAMAAPLPVAAPARLAVPA